MAFFLTWCFWSNASFGVGRGLESLFFPEKYAPRLVPSQQSRTAFASSKIDQGRCQRVADAVKSTPSPLHLKAYRIRP
eukprot:3189137-Amphidinium_carterae.1